MAGAESEELRHQRGAAEQTFPVFRRRKVTVNRERLKALGMWADGRSNIIKDMRALVSGGLVGLVNAQAEP